MKAVLVDVDADRRHLLGRFATREVQGKDDLGPGAKQIGEINGAGESKAPRAGWRAGNGAEGQSSRGPLDSRSRRRAQDRRLDARARIARRMAFLFAPRHNSMRPHTNLW